MTYGTNAPNGLVPVRMLNGAAWTGATNTYPILSTYATSLFRGDPVTLGNDGYLAVGVAGAAIMGVFWGVKYIQTDGTVKFANYWPANPGILTGSSVEALVIDDPNTIFTCQETSSTGTAGTALTQADIGLNINFLYTAGNTSTGQSAVSLNNESEDTTDTLNMKLIQLDPNSSFGNYANFWVIINNSRYRTGITGV